MNNIDEVTTLLLIKFNVQDQTELKAKTKVFAGVYAGSLFKSLIVTASLKEAAELLGCSDRTVQRVLRTLFDPKSERGGSVRQQLLEHVGYKYCSGCDGLLYLAGFNNSKSRCKVCLKGAFTEYYVANKASIINRVTIRNTLKISRIPSWANLAKIKEFYAKCPEGCHVDHIVPLQGELVSGLHVENNLQYLTAEENLRKGNKWVVS